MFRSKQFTTGEVVYWTESSVTNEVYQIIIKRGRIITCDRKQSCVKTDDANELSWISNSYLFNRRSDLKNKYNLPWSHGD